MKTKLLFAWAILFTFYATHAQAPQEAVAQMIRTKLGDQCIIRNEEGKQISFNQAAQLTLGASALSKRVKYEPIKVVEGISHEVRIKLVEPSAMKPLLDEIDFTNTQLGFYSQSKEKITGDEFKSTLQASPNLSAAAYQASNGVITDFFIISKPKPASVQMVSSGANASSNSVISFEFNK